MSSNLYQFLVGAAPSREKKSRIIAIITRSRLKAAPTTKNHNYYY
jgi:hypothetical protein